MLLRIVSHWFVAGVVVGYRAAPIIKYMGTWSRRRIEAYCQQRGWECEEVKETR